MNTENYAVGTHSELANWSA